MNRPERRMSRRDFLELCGRAGAFAALAYLSARIFAKVSRGDETCVNGWICRSCGRFSGCGLPQALSARRALKRGAS